MSGPKTSRYTLTAEQQRILAEQREIERRKAVALESIKQNKDKLVKMSSLFSSEKQISNELLNRTGSDNGFANKLRELDAVLATAVRATEGIDDKDVSILENIAISTVENYKKAENIVKDLYKVAAQNEVVLRLKLNDTVSQGFVTSFADIEKQKGDSIETVKEKAVVELIELKKNICLTDELIAEINDAVNKLDKIDNETFIKNYIALTVSPLVKRCKCFIDEYKMCYEEFEELYAEYIALCDLYFYVAQEFICCNESIEVLKSEIERIKTTADVDDEQAYISECLDEVMEEMGYSVIGSREVTKKNGKHFRNELYTYGEGTAVNVTYSSDGKIAMELGGVDTTDRLPDAQETSVLCESMECFCDDFKEIEKRLLAKGVILASRISMLPPSAEYAQIINTTDYQMSGNVDKLQAKKKRQNMKTERKQSTL